MPDPKKPDPPKPAGPAKADGPAAAPPREAARPYEGGPPLRHPDTGEPQPVVDPPGDPARAETPPPGDAPGGKAVKADDAAALREENDALRKQLDELRAGGAGAAPGDLTRLAGENADLKRQVAAAGPPTHRVSCGPGLPALDVASADGTEGGAVAAYMARLGVYRLPQQPAVGPAGG